MTGQGYQNTFYMWETWVYWPNSVTVITVWIQSYLTLISWEIKPYSSFTENVIKRYQNVQPSFQDWILVMSAVTNVRVNMRRSYFLNRTWKFLLHLCFLWVWTTMENLRNTQNWQNNELSGNGGYQRWKINIFQLLESTQIPQHINMQLV